MREVPKMIEIHNIIANRFYLKNGEEFDFLEMYGRKEIDEEATGRFSAVKTEFLQNLELTRLPYKPDINDNEYQSNNLFSLKSVHDWISEASKRPMPKQLFSFFWYEGEICILFADTNTGKSILAVQIADAISSGLSIRNFPREAQRQSVLYVDFELSDKQFQIRYTSDQGNIYIFHEDFFRAELNADCYLPKGKNFEKFIVESIEDLIIQNGVKIIIIDNLTYLRQDSEKGKDALSLMKELKSLKSKYELSILCLAHVPKRDTSKPISKNDLAGSKMLINFCDSSFAIGESVSDTSIRYLKQIKARNNAIVFDTDNVAVFKIEKFDCFLKFDFIDYSTEREHLRQPSEDDRQKRTLEAKEMKASGKSNRDIAKYYGLTEAAIRKWNL